MGRFTPSLGFTPDTIEDIMAKLRQELENVLGIRYENDEEFLDTNIYRLFLGFATELASNEDAVIDVIDSFVTWVNETNNTIGFTRSGTYAGMNEAFSEHFKGVMISSGNLDAKIPAGVALVALDNSDENDNVPNPIVSEDEKEKIAEVFKNYWPTGILTTCEAIVPPVENTVTVSLHTNEYDNQDYNVTMVKVIPLEIHIVYEPFAHTTIPNAQDQTLKDMFMASFNAQNAIGRDFDPQSYISTQNVPWLSSCVCEWKESGSSLSFSGNRYAIPAYYNKFVIARDENTQIPIISVNIKQ